MKVLCDWLVKPDSQPNSQRISNMVIEILMCLKDKRYRLKGLRLSNGKCVIKFNVAKIESNGLEELKVSIWYIMLK